MRDETDRPEINTFLRSTLISKKLKLNSTRTTEYNKKQKAEEC